jgi:transcriptional regulator with XRE-family HTH domain
MLIRTSGKRAATPPGIIGGMKRTASERLAASEHKTTVGANVALARTSLGLTQAEFARAIGVAQNKLSQWESGDHYPSPFYLQRACAEFGFTMDWFYRGVSAGVSSERADDLRRARADKLES